MSIEEAAGVSERQEVPDGGRGDAPALLEPVEASPTRFAEVGGPPAPLELVATLCRTLEAERVRYCHWKSNEAIDLSETGENDLDLLVSRSDAQRFEEILRRLGFKDVQLPPWKQLPGVFHSYGLDERSGRLVHIHAHYQLVIGDDMTKNYRLPIEEAYLASAARGSVFQIPAPEFEFAAFVLRMVIKHSSWDALLSFQGSLSPSERRELTDLIGKVDTDGVWAIMGRHLPSLSVELWERCLRSVRPGSSVWFRVRTASRLQRELAACSRRHRYVDTYLKTWRRFRTLVRRKLFRRGPVRKELAAGGALIAIVGGDGAGKSTAVDELSRWLTEEFSTVAVHLGKPPKSLLSRVLKGLMGLAASVKPSPTSSASALRTSLASSSGESMGLRNHARLVWEVLTARDRYRAYARARRSATNGSIVVCDRYPLTEIKLMDGAVTARMVDPPRFGRTAKYLSDLERRFYGRIAYPDTLIVLRVDPDLAVQRRLGEDEESYLRPRSEEIWRLDWRGTPAIVIDADRPKAEVLSEIRSVVWSRL
jgi:thymidylate kinase